MSLSGTFSTMPLTELLTWIHQSRKTGTLIVHGDIYSKKVFLQKGTIVSSASDDPTEYLGHFLLRMGRITEAQLQSAMEAQQHTNVMLGRILVTAGAIEENELNKLLLQKAEETIFGLFLWPEARFEFIDGEIPSNFAVPLRFSIDEVLMKGLAWYDELTRIRDEFGSARTVFARTGQDTPVDFASGQALGRRVLEMVDGRRSITDICLEVHASEFTVSRILYILHRKGCVRVTHRAGLPEKAPRKTYSELIEEVRSLLRGGEPEQALMVIEEARPFSPHDVALRHLRDEAQAAFSRLAAVRGLEPARVPVMLKPLESLTGELLTSEEVFLLSRINGTWDVRSIVSLCPFPETDALLHLKNLRDKGILTFEQPR